MNCNKGMADQAENNENQSHLVLGPLLATVYPPIYSSLGHMMLEYNPSWSWPLSPKPNQTYSHLLTDSSVTWKIIFWLSKREQLIGSSLSAMQCFIPAILINYFKAEKLSIDITPRAWNLLTWFQFKRSLNEVQKNLSKVYQLVVLFSQQEIFWRDSNILNMGNYRG